MTRRVIARVFPEHLRRQAAGPLSILGAKQLGR